MLYSRLHGALRGSEDRLPQAVGLGFQRLGDDEPGGVVGRVVQTHPAGEVLNAHLDRVGAGAGGAADIVVRIRAAAGLEGGSAVAGGIRWEVERNSGRSPETSPTVMSVVRYFNATSTPTRHSSAA